MKDIIYNNKLQTAVKAVCILFALMLCYYGIVSFNASISTLLLFIAFMLFCVLIPGMAILKNLNVTSDHISTALARGFFTGFAFNILL